MFIMVIIGLFKPYANKRENILEILNEYTILVLFCHLITQTDFVLNMAARRAMGWSLIVLISVNIIVNFGNILILELWTLCRKIKLFYLKRIWL